MKYYKEINLQELQRNRNGTDFYVNLIRTRTVSVYVRSDDALKMELRAISCHRNQSM